MAVLVFKISKGTFSQKKRQNRAKLASGPRGIYRSRREDLFPPNESSVAALGASLVTKQAPWIALDRPGLPWIALDRPGSPWIALARRGSPWIALDRPGSPRIAPDRPGSPRIAPDRPGSPRIAPDRPGSPRIAPDRPGSLRIALGRPGSPRIAMDRHPPHPHGSPWGRHWSHGIPLRGFSMKWGGSTSI